MIFDYLIDFRYLASTLKALEPGDPTLDNFKKIIDACVRPGENGRLVIDSDRHILKDLEAFLKDPKALVAKPSRFAQQVSCIVEWFLRTLPAKRFVGRQMVGVNLSDGHKICVRDIPVFESNLSRIMNVLCSIKPPPNVIISEREDWGNVDCVGLSSYESFDAVEAARGELRSLQRVVLSGEHEGVPIVDFWRQLHTFGAAEETEFSIYDPYGFDTNNAEKRKILMLWIAHMLGGRNIQRRNLMVRICSKCGKNDYIDGIPAQLDEQLGRLKTRIAKEAQISHLGAISLELKFLFAVDDKEDEVSKRFSMDVQHDRFICSSTHYFGIGAGIDSVGNREAFNVQYKGRVGNVPLLKELASFYDSKENLNAGRVRVFTCRV